MLLSRIVSCSGRVGATRGRLEKQTILASLLGSLDPGEVLVAASYLSGSLPQGRIGVGPAALTAAITTAPADEASLTLQDVDARFTAIAGIAGKGSVARREAALYELFTKATSEEQRFLAQLLMGELRQGALEGVLIAALAKAAGAPEADVRRATMLSGSFPDVAHAVLIEGVHTLARFRLVVGRPIQPMLAQTADDPAAALAELGEAGFEHKLDGARIQVHKAGDDVRVFTRHLQEVTGAVPDVTALVRTFAADTLVLDGEALVLRADGRPLPFQDTMRRFGSRFGSRSAGGAEAADMPLRAFFFDCLRVDDDDVLDAALSDRLEALACAVPEAHRVPRLVTADPAAAQAFFDDAVAAGHEGVMAKALDAPYAAGARGKAWLKIKIVHTLDLVVLAVEWGSGRRRGLLSNLHLGARDPEGGFVMLGKTFKGLTDELLAWQTEQLLARKVAEEGHVVHVRPELVVEVAFNELQRSPRYPGGLALRFARVKRYRDDKGPEEADTMATVWQLFRGQLAHQRRAGGGK